MVMELPVHSLIFHNQDCRVVAFPVTLLIVMQWRPESSPAHPVDFRVLNNDCLLITMNRHVPQYQGIVGLFIMDMDVYKRLGSSEQLRGNHVGQDRAH